MSRPNRRLTAAEKGKGLVVEAHESQVRRIRAPPLDTSALIRENALTLIGRLTNPQEQRIWALIASLPRKWNARGRVVGADLGHNCFQFRFEREDDLQRVLDNRPYHFNYWMVVIQKWEPVISGTFPSMIPFWIRIKGLPLHFWQDAMICKIGRDLGEFETHELTKTVARVRVLVDGLKPLIKETIVEFDSGEECLVTLEYERLENHCDVCLLLSHNNDSCPIKEKTTKLLMPAKETEMKPDTQDSYTTPSANLRVEKNHKEEFHQRVDRHGRPYGERISTKQTRVPPPIIGEKEAYTSYRRRGETYRREEPSYASPPVR